ncbi:MAG: chromate efflux transporter [Planctomycetota bacterium]|nr:MAG: chromate efflux transporter [Planctomycetota bacterium]
MSDHQPPNHDQGSPWEVLRVFGRLGLSSFGGPIAHLAYFREELVQRRGWISEERYANLLALCQFLPGPASSQLGFCLGLFRAGWLGAFAAFAAFTLPSVLLLVCFAMLAPQLSGGGAAAAIHGLKLVALAVVAHGVLGMSKKLCPDPLRASLAVATCALVLLIPGALIQLACVAGAGLIGSIACRSPAAGGQLPNPPLSPRSGALLIAIALGLLALLPLLTLALGGGWALFDAFYRSGALVFGGGHVVLPWLEEAVVQPGWVDADTFLAGYGAAQAVPGPLFSFAAYLGFVSSGPLGGLSGALLATLAIFAPGFLLVAGVLPFWSRLSALPRATNAVSGVSAAVVGLLGAALYQPLWTSAVGHAHDLVIALVAFLLIASWRCSALWAVAWCMAASWAAWALNLYPPS